MPSFNQQLIKKTYQLTKETIYRNHYFFNSNKKDITIINILYINTLCVCSRLNPYLNHTRMVINELDQLGI